MKSEQESCKILVRKSSGVHEECLVFGETYKENFFIHRKYFRPKVTLEQAYAITHKPSGYLVCEAGFKTLEDAKHFIDWISNKNEDAFSWEDIFEVSRNLPEKKVNKAKEINKKYSGKIISFGR